ncbi:MAG: glutamate--tRNA ligase [Gammaproteobacteria bacterium]|nr:glutamate--tRNA ligase [Gammaproteobacteria bacterium]MDE0252903.1 glutamate--tRNA ligase [Gammaproteobacteria bacterium]MDE0402084.1 glutamate--tRNA ligase [Gammaproteobacteria bacterium]
MKVRTRVAPSPTGDPHLGTAYVALFNRVFAHQCNGQFVLRIEDTDQERSRQSSVKAIQDTLRWLGLDWDEGPDIGGPFSPYIASERLQIYQSIADKLCETGMAFPCFCSKERLADVRAHQRERKLTPKYDGHCVSLSRQKVSSLKAAGKPFVIRLLVPNDGVCEFHDQLRGKITVPWSQVDMQVLLKSDGFPTYHLAAAVDDHLMEITHIFRGEEWLSSCPKQQLIYQGLEWQVPALYHLPLLRNSDRSKLSKRKQATSINYYKRSGFLPKTLLNYLATMGWSMPDEREKFTMQEFQKHFDPTRLSTTGPVFDIDKLKWLNGEYIRELSLAQFKEQLLDWSFGEQRLERILQLMQERTEKFDDVFTKMDYLIGDRVEVVASQFEDSALTREDCLRVLEFTQRKLNLVEPWNRDEIFKELKQLSVVMNLKFRDFLKPLFIAISGRSVSLPLFDSIEILGSDITMSRLRSAIVSLGGISKKQLKVFDKDWQSLHSHPLE